MKMTASSVRVEGSGQKMDYVEQLYQGRTKDRVSFRVRIHIDTYAEQAWADVQRWDGAKWHEVVSVGGHALKTDLHLGYKRDVNESAKIAAFQEDRDRLLALAEEVVG